jgi:hypothetical protein
MDGWVYNGMKEKEKDEREMENTRKGPSTLLVLMLEPIHTTSKYTDPHAPKPGEQLK